jgi:hypothetical protein
VRYSKTQLAKIFLDWPSYMGTTDLRKVEAKVDFIKGWMLRYGVSEGQAKGEIYFRWLESNDSLEEATNVAEQLYEAVNRRGMYAVRKER